MPKPFHELTLEEFIDLLGVFTFHRKIESVHMHHTWRPNHADFAANPGVKSIEGMFNFHTQTNGWSDIAQHITIDPNGKVWTGRDWNRPPASAVGFNGNADAGPFMFEMIGDFDLGRDPFAGAQKATAIGVVQALLKRFSLPVEAVRFHNQMSTKSCPGSGLDRAAFLAELSTARDLADTAPSAFGSGSTAVRQKSLEIAARWQAAERSLLAAANESEPAEDAMNANEVAVITGNESPAAAAQRGIFGAGPDFTAEEKQILRPHVVNLRLGLFSDTGKFTTSLADVRRIFEELLPAELDRLKSMGKKLHLVFYAHGGLVSEEQGIRPCLRRLPFWRGNDIYPIFFCWETGLSETVSDLVQSLFKGERGFVSDIADEVLEAVAGPAGRKVWGEMKRSAELASMTGGGARTVAEMTRDFWNVNHADMEIHAVGHSAGSIFHSFFLPTLLDLKPAAGAPAIAVKTLHYLAPACTTDLFETRLKNRIGPGKAIEKHTMYTMNKDLEQADKAGPYQKSLLYFVSRAFEPVKPTPILGLEESLRDDAALIRFYGLSRTIPGIAQILFSKTPSNAPLDSATESTSHGDFDNEVKTMNSVARRILDRPSGTIVSFVDETANNEVTRALTAIALPKVASRFAVTRSTGAKKALCIGIDSYSAPNTLRGCVNDANSWAALLASLDFEAETLLNAAATRDTILTRMRSLIGSANPGDVIVLQYSGHGTQVTDLDGDEQDGKDEAIVPVDFGTGRFIIDDDLRAIMQTIPAGVNVTCMMDCCHSGTNTRLLAPNPVTAGGGSLSRFMPITEELDQLHIAFRRSSASRAFASMSRTAENMREVNFAACRPDQVAFESNGAGDFTTRALPILRGFQGNMSNAEFQRRVIASFGAGARQEPTLDCASEAKDASLFGASTSADRGATTLAGRVEDLERRVTQLGG